MNQLVGSFENMALSNADMQGASKLTTGVRSIPARFFAQHNYVPTPNERLFTSLRKIARIQGWSTAAALAARNELLEEMGIALGASATKYTILKLS